MALSILGKRAPWGLLAAPPINSAASALVNREKKKEEGRRRSKKKIIISKANESLVGDRRKCEAQINANKNKLEML